MNGCPATEISALGMLSVSGRMRVASPPARITHCMPRPRSESKSIRETEQPLDPLDLRVEESLLIAGALGDRRERGQFRREAITETGPDTRLCQPKRAL